MNHWRNFLLPQLNLIVFTGAGIAQTTNTEFPAPRFFGDTIAPGFKFTWKVAPLLPVFLFQTLAFFPGVLAIA